MTVLKRTILTVIALYTSLLPAQTRRALVIGNDSYPGNALQNARNDASGVYDALRSAGYTATLVLDADRTTLSDKVDSFADSLHTGDTAFLYYAGHGMQVGGENYLVPVDFHLTSEESAKDQGYSLSSVLERLTSHGATTQVVILDACRDNPFMGARSMRGGWAGMGTSAGTFLAFGTSPGSTASDDPAGGHGLFTKSLLRYMTSSDLDIEEMFRKVREGVIRDSGGKQVPWVSSSLIGSLHIRPEIDAKAAALSPIDSVDTGSDSVRSRSLGDEGATAGEIQPTPQEQAQLEQALAFARGAHFDSALRIVQDIVSLDPRCAVALRVLSLLFHFTGRDVEAISTVDRAISTSRDDPRAATYKCALEGYSGRTSASEDCAAAVHAQPSSNGYLVYAGALLAQGDSDQAYTNATQAISVGGDDLAYALRGVIAAHQGRQGLAERDFTRAAQLSADAEK